MQKALLTSIVVLFGLGGQSRPSWAHPKDEAGLGKCDAVRLTARCAARPDVGFDGLWTGVDPATLQAFASPLRLPPILPSTLLRILRHLRSADAGTSAAVERSVTYGDCEATVCP
jgi:hypothetical protein